MYNINHPIRGLEFWWDATVSATRESPHITFYWNCASTLLDSSLSYALSYIFWQRDHFPCKKPIFFNKYQDKNLSNIFSFFVKIPSQLLAGRQGLITIWKRNLHFNCNCNKVSTFIFGFIHLRTGWSQRYRIEFKTLYILNLVNQQSPIDVHISVH